jgi:hypothetical protein
MVLFLLFADHPSQKCTDNRVNVAPHFENAITYPTFARCFFNKLPGGADDPRHQKHNK